MLAELRPYPAIKHSGMPWLGEIPEHWETARNGRLFTQRNQTGFAELPILEVSIRAGARVRNMEPSGRKQVMSEREKYKRACAGDIAYNTMRMWQGAVGAAPVDGLVSPAYVVARPVAGINSAYFERVFRLPEYMDEVNRCSRGIVSDRNRLYWEDFKQIASPLPPPGEQTAIVRFLDHADRRIRRYIRAKQKLIKLLEEQKQAIVHRGVTRGLEPNVRLKPSGVEWLGNVPEHWELKKLRQCGKVAGGLTPSMENRRFWDGAIPWVTPKDMKREAICDSSIRVAEAAIRETSLRLIDPPAVLIVVRGMILARRVPIAWITGPVTINQDMKALKPTSEINAEFLARSLESAQDAFVPLIDEAGHGTRRLPTERWRDLVVATPPEREQASIATFLNESTCAIVATMDRARRQIALLREYRTRLIADVVTGKLDVRAAAAQLPDEPPEPDEPIDAEPDTADDLDAIPEEAAV